MKKIARLSVIMAVALLFAAPDSLAGEDDDQGYTLHPGDQIHISVWRSDTLNQTVVVLPDGNITFPLAGRVMVAGLTSIQVEEQLAEKLGSFFADPEITVSIVGVEGNRVFVLGKVNQPGLYVLSGPTNISQILSMAGGLVKFARQDEIKILRGQGDAAIYIPFNYDDLLFGKNGAAATIMLEAGDVIVIP